MCFDWLKGLRKYAIGTCVALAFSANVARAADDDADLRKMIEAQAKQIEELKHRLDAGATEAAEQGAEPKAANPKYVIDDASIKRIVSDYLKENPGSGMPSGVQTGYYSGQGFRISSAPNPAYSNWDDESRIPFDLRLRGRIQIPYYFYKVTDKRNHLTGARLANNAAGDFSQLEVKRMRLNFSGTAFSPNLRYMIELDGGTRGIGALGAGNGLAGGGNNVATVDHAMRLFQAWVAYDFRPCCWYKGCGDECCCEGSPKYAPTFSLVCGKFKPGFAYEQMLGSGNEQFVEYGMTNWFFDADDDNLTTGAGFQIKAAEDRLYVQGMIDNGEETQIANTQMDRLPGFTLIGWYDFGGTWDCERHVWQLYGDCASDIDYSCNPVVRVGAAGYAAPNDRRSIYTNAELNRIRVVPGGTNIVTLLNGGTQPAAAAAGTNSLDAVDDYRLEAFVAGKYRGFSFLADGFLRNLDNFRGVHVPGTNLNQPILYNNGAGQVSLFPARHGLLDYGTQLQAGYFLIPKHLEVCARWCWIRGDSGNINGNGTQVTRAAGTVPGVAAAVGPVRVVNGAFDHFSEVNEYTVGVNYFWKRQNVKWQTDLGWYNGGNPAAGGSSAAGFITGVDGWLARTQIQLWF